MCIVDISFLKEKCLKLEKSLKHDNLLDIDGFDLISELNVLRKIIALLKILILYGKFLANLLKKFARKYFSCHFF